jgi:hypothetical protein
MQPHIDPKAFKAGRSPAEKSSLPVRSDTDDSPDMIQAALDWCLNHCDIDRSKTVPFLGGMSTDGTTVYINSGAPESLRVGKVTVPLDPYFALHELVESALMSHLNMPYKLAHALAQRLERALVSDSGANYERYNELGRELEDQAYKQQGPVPDDLDLRPYQEEGQLDLLRRGDHGASVTT